MNVVKSSIIALVMGSGLFIAACGDSDPTGSAATTVNCENKQGDQVVVVRCGDDAPANVPPIPN